MIAIRGHYYDGVSSRRQDAELLHDGQGLSLRAGDETLFRVRPEEVEIAPRLGDTARRIEFPSGAAFETKDNEGVDRLLGAIDPSPLAGLLHRLESNYPNILLSLLLVVAFVWWFIAHALPWTAERLAQRLPDEVSRQINRHSIAFMEREWLKPSRLPPERQAEILRRFEAGLGTAGLARPRILFRDTETLGANALALPPDTLVFTDQLVKLAQRDEELTAVLFHEMGHLEGRHGIRQAIQNSALTLIGLLIFGDISSITDVGIGIPLMLTQLGYSRHFEREADVFALLQLRRNGIAPEHFANILLRLEQQALCERGKKGADKDCASAASHPLFHYLSTHPDTGERIAAFKR